MRSFSEGSAVPGGVAGGTWDIFGCYFGYPRPGAHAPRAANGRPGLPEPWASHWGSQCVTDQEWWWGLDRLRERVKARPGLLKKAGLCPGNVLLDGLPPNGREVKFSAARGLISPETEQRVLIQPKTWLQTPAAPSQLLPWHPNKQAPSPPD